MRWTSAAFGIAILAIGITPGTPMAVQSVCLHGPGETPEQAARRKQAIAFSRQLHNEQLKAFQASKAYLTLDRMPVQTPPEGFEVRLAADRKGYAFSVVDQTDPCKFGYFSNETGLIYKGEPLQ